MFNLGIAFTNGEIEEDFSAEIYDDFDDLLESANESWFVEAENGMSLDDIERAYFLCDYYGDDVVEAYWNSEHTLDDFRDRYIGDFSSYDEAGRHCINVLELAIPDWLDPYIDYSEIGEGFYVAYEKSYFALLN